MLIRVTTPFADMLTGGHPNSLGRTEEVVGVVLADHGRLDELFATMADPDDVVRTRIGDALERSAASDRAGSCRTSNTSSATSGISTSRQSNGTSPRCCSTFTMTFPTIKRSWPCGCCDET